MPNDFPEFFIDDGLQTLDVGHWAKTKHNKIGYYCSLFASSMKNKWDYRIYIDLFAGSGKCRIRNTNKIIPGSPLISLGVQQPFDKYVFCEKDSTNIIALKERCKEYFPDRDCDFIEGDANNKLSEIFSSIPRFSKTFRGLSLCFVDPYKKGELDFKTIQSIANNLYVDFLVLIPSFMDLNRNKHNYTRLDDYSLDIYLGTKRWRDRWDNIKDKNKTVFL
ncbi:three-Cys-motif partner protein TcmP [Deltaproteobacteria bacterium]|nr:three-Cys-motif partner protein TcmP [Deltaproteobacteria bacterium]